MARSIIGPGLRCLIASAALLGIMSSPAMCAAEVVTVTGKVVDEAGKPVGQAQVAQTWSGDAQTGKMTPDGGVTTDSDGTFKIEINLYGRPSALLAFNSKQDRAGLLRIDKETVGKDVKIALSPVSLVRGSFTCSDLKRNPPWTNVYVYVDGRDGRPVSCDSSDAEFAFLLPAGKYSLNCYGSGVIGINKEIEVSAEGPESNVGKIDLRATGIALHKGKAPPKWNITDARGIAKTVKWSDLKGKWVLMEFWGFW